MFATVKQTDRENKRKEEIDGQTELDDIAK